MSCVNVLNASCGMVVSWFLWRLSVLSFVNVLNASCGMVVSWLWLSLSTSVLVGMSVGICVRDLEEQSTIVPEHVHIPVQAVGVGLHVVPLPEYPSLQEHVILSPL